MSLCPTKLRITCSRSTASTRGQARNVEYVMLTCAGTIEEAEYRRLREKAALQADLLGDPSSQRVTRAMALEDLVSSLDRLGRNPKEGLR